ncbi:MAG TPA: DUF4395 domain-containing protein [Acidimicrobiales bacterium]|jgi:hypothetical protein|nr:DUF4395 domain-containing protein [Acidimicrobiales bacterium]
MSTRAIGLDDKEGLFSFPNPVNEVSARLVAGGVVLMALAGLVLRQPLVLVPLAYGFWARVLTGPKLSPLGQFVTRVVTPALPVEPKPVPGPPKRFAQGVGAAVTTTALALAILGASAAAYALLGVLVVFATLESVFALCVGCKVFAVLMRLGVIPPEVCEACNNISLRPKDRVAPERGPVLQGGRSPLRPRRGR